MNNTTYDSQQFTIQELLNQAQDKKITIPCIQRPFVWSPKQIAVFIDSLLRGWPYGTMLFLEKSNSGESLFSSRCFVTQISSEERPDKEEEISYQYLVLDGQQRYQSMYTVFAPHSEGYEATAKEWADDGCPVSGKKANHEKYVRYLCFNLNAWKNGWADSYVETDELEDAGIIWKTREELEAGKDQFVKICDVFAGAATTSSDYNDTLSFLTRTVESLKNHCVPILIINQDKCGDSGEREDAVVRMFTRLNMAGTPLTKEQLLAATIKKSWQDFPARIEEFRAYYSGKNYNMELSIDDVVNGFNIIIKAITGEKDTRDAYKKIQTTAGWERYWQLFRIATQDVFDGLQSRKMHWKHEYSSLYLIWYAVALLGLKHKSSDVSENGMADSVDEIIHVLIKWMFVSTWSKIWSNRSGQSVKHYMNEILSLPEKFSPSEVIQKWVMDAKLQEGAKASVERLMASSRGDVRQYYTYLLVWHRMESERAKLITRFGKEASWDVDHLIPFAWSENKKELHHVLSNLGNCWLLNSSANVKKSDSSFKDFLSTYNEDDKLSKISSTLCTTDVHLSQELTDINSEELEKQILEREKSIKDSLKQYIEDSNHMELSYDEEENVANYDVGIFEGNAYIKSPHYKNLKTEKSKSSYLSNIRRVHNALGWSKKTGPCESGTTLKAVKENIKNNKKEYIKRVPEDCNNCKSAWSAYVSFLAGETRKRNGNTNGSSSDNIGTLNVDKIYLGTEFLQSLTCAPRTKRDYASNTRSAMRKLELTAEDMAQKNEAELETLYQEAGQFGNCAKGWRRYLQFLKANL